MDEGIEAPSTSDLITTAENNRLPSPVPSGSPNDTSAATLERRHHRFVRRISQRYGYSFIGHEADFIDWLTRAEQLVANVAASHEPPFESMVDRHGRSRFKLTKIGRQLFHVFKSYSPKTADHYTHHRFNPPLTVILSVVKQHAAELLYYTNQHGSLVLGEQAARDNLKRAVTAIRETCRSAQYKDEVDNYRRNEEKNIASCCEYLAAQFRRRSQLLILRVDLYFRPLFRGWGYTREADQQYARFLRALRENRIVPDVLGYIGKREDGIDRGIHYHVLIVLDGHKRRNAAHLTWKLGEDWVRRCGHGEYDDGIDVGEGENKEKGSYFNCYTRVNEYEFNCLGLIHPTDTGKLRGLRAAIEYLCKETTQLKPTPPKPPSEGAEGEADTPRTGIRNLRKGITPKGHSGRGAPRRSGLDTSAIDRELLKT